MKGPLLGQKKACDCAHNDDLPSWHSRVIEVSMGCEYVWTQLEERPSSCRSAMDEVHPSCRLVSTVLGLVQGMPSDGASVKPSKVLFRGCLVCEALVYGLSLEGIWAIDADNGKARGRSGRSMSKKVV